jgi:hypothetical protein
VSQLPLFEADPVDQPAATDPVERRTWSALRIRIGNRTVTRLWDKSLDAERTLLYVPVFPIAQWIVRNWWNLFYEPSRSEDLPLLGTTKEQFAWIKRHSIRSAESGMLLPSLYFYSNGKSFRAEWHADQPDSLQHMPGRFIETGSESLHLEAAKAAMAHFVGETLERTLGMNDDRVRELHSDWLAIQAADSEESQFCVIAGRMGLDPYDPTEVNDELAEFIEQNVSDPDLPIVRDLTEVAEATTLANQWNWVRQTSRLYQIGQFYKGSQNAASSSEWTSPAHYGYEWAHRVRSFADLQSAAPILSVEELAKPFTDKPLIVQSHNHVPGRGIRALVGLTPERQGIIAGPLPQREDNRRFLLARGLYNALFGSQTSERLVTDAFTWDQQVSRAFAAELLAPRQALLDRIDGWVDEEQVAKLANEFGTSAVLIVKQLKNAGAAGFD